MDNLDLTPKCLLVDDLEENLIALKALLHEESVEIKTARSGEEALELLLLHDFAFAMVDVQMPGMNGFELAEIMRSTERTKTIPIIFVTAAGTDVQRIFRGYEAGAVDFLHKPLYPQVVLGKVRVFLDLFKQKKLLEQKIQSLHETELSLQNALASRDEFLSICSHELKTPLTSLKLMLQMNERLKRKLGEEAAFTPQRMKKFMESSDQCIDRLIHLVNEMLDLSRVTTGRLSLKLESTDLAEMVTEVVERLRGFMEVAHCEVKVTIKENLTSKIDRFRIEQVLMNLLTNAAKYAPENPVEVLVDRTEKCALISVRDHGPGISQEDQERIFNKFERATPYTSVSGLGLGLYISKEIVDMHRGTLSVSSIPGEGSTFSIELPIEKLEHNV